MHIGIADDEFSGGDTVVSNGNLGSCSSHEGEKYLKEHCHLLDGINRHCQPFDGFNQHCQQFDSINRHC